MNVRRPRLRSRRWLLVAALALVAAGCASDAPLDTLDPAGPGAESIQNLFVPVIWVAAAVFVFVEGLIILAVVRFRRRGPGDDAVPAQVHGNTRLEVFWTIAPAVILAFIAVPTVATLFNLFEEPEDPLNVTVTGQQWWWGYEYPEFGIVTANELHIPAGQPVFLTLQSKDVIHSFWAPRLNGKRDVVPGRAHNWTIQADEPGVYGGECAEFCGASHANMLLRVVAHDEADWDAWVAAQQQEGEVPTTGLAAEGHALFQQRGCVTCHVIDGVYEEEIPPESPPAPNLTHFAARDCLAGCMFENDRNNLEAWLRNPPARKPGSLMPNLALSESDIDALATYLETLD
jgi:cytochrome c oxidase subunit II